MSTTTSDLTRYQERVLQWALSNEGCRTDSAPRQRALAALHATGHLMEDWRFSVEERADLLRRHRIHVKKAYDALSAYTHDDHTDAVRDHLWRIAHDELTLAAYCAERYENRTWRLTDRGKQRARDFH